MNTWRKNGLIIGRVYRVTTGFSSPRFAFYENERLKLIRAPYSVYDGVTGYVFESLNSHDIKSWDLHDHDADQSGELFMEVN